MRQLFMITIGLATCLASPAAHAQLAATGTDCSQSGLGCRYWPPPAYDPSQRYPLVLYLHSAGDAGSNNTSQVDGWGSFPRQFLDDARRAKYQFFFLAPQAPTDEGDSRWVNWDWSKGSYDINAIPESTSMKVAMTMLDALTARFSVDLDRVYVVGESMGGFGTWDALSRHPERFAGGIPTDGGGSPQAAPRLTNMAVLSAHYGMDGSVPVSSDREMFAALARAGGRPLYVEVAQAAHGVAGAINGQESLYEWLFSQRRGVPPSTSPGLLDFSPAGGVFPSPTDVALSSALSPALRYTTDGSVPTPTSGTAYARPIHLSTSSILEAAVFLHDDDGDRSIYHAAPFQIGDTPLPAGAAIVPPPATGSAGSSGGAMTGGTGGTSTLGGATSGGASTLDVGGAPSGVGAGAFAGMAAGAPSLPGAAGGSAGASPAPAAPAAGCSCALPRTGHGEHALLLALAVLAGAARRRRRPSEQKN
jgi:MYXO-CTERM domain-containing protein